VEKGAFESTTVRWERGHPATLVVFDETGGEVERHDVEKWDIATIRETLQAKGFHHKTATMPKPKGGWFGHDSGAADRAVKRLQPIAAA
jgi:hypothetical protein